MDFLILWPKRKIPVSSPQRSTEMFWNGSAWSILGTAGNSIGAASSTVIQLKTTGEPIVFYADQGLGGLGIVRQFIP